MPGAVPGEAAPVAGVRDLVVQFLAVVVRLRKGKNVADTDRAIPPPGVLNDLERDASDVGEEEKDLPARDEFPELQRLVAADVRARKKFGRLLSQTVLTNVIAGNEIDAHRMFGLKAHFSPGRGVL